MSEVFYTKETGWTKAGIAEQEQRRKMEIGLMKLTAEELLREHNKLLNRYGSDCWDEIRRRLERLEKCGVEIGKLKKRIIDDDAFAASALKQAHLEIQRLAAKVKAARAALEEKDGN